MKILFVHEVSYSTKVVFEMHDYPELLSLRGHDVTFVDFPEGEQHSGVSRFVSLRTTVKEGVSRAHEGASIRVITPGRVLPPPLDRALASMTHVPVIWKLLRSEGFDAVVLYGVPTNGWQTVLMARRFGVPVLFRAIDVSHKLRKTRLAPLIRMAENFIYRNADAVSTHNVGLADYVVHNGAQSDRVSIEYPGLDLDRFAPRPRDPELARSLGIEGHHRVILFMGTLYRFAGLESFLKAIAADLHSNADLRVLLVGGGEEESNLKGLCDELNIAGSVMFTGLVDYGSLADYLSLGDVAINPFDRSEVTDNALPGKVLQYLGCGLPTVSTPLRGLVGLTGDSDGIRYVQNGTPFVEAVLSWLLHDADRSGASQAARELMETTCGWTAAIDKFVRALPAGVRPS